MKIVVVTGSREWNGDRAAMARELGDFDLLVVGDALGADLAAVNIAKKRGLDHGNGIYAFYAADYGKWPSCGPKRNSAMVKYAAECVQAGHDVRWFAFPQRGAANKGTNDCMRKMKRAGATVRVVEGGADGR